MFARIFTLSRKEFIHIRRDPRSLTIVFLLPVIMVLLYGYAITLDVKNIPTGVMDFNHTAQSRILIDKLVHSGYFVIKAHPQNYEEIHELFQKRIIKLAVVIPVDYGEKLRLRPSVAIQVLVDGSDSNVGAIAINYVRSILQRVSQQINTMHIVAPFKIEPRVWYNPNLKSSVFFVPGLVAVILMMISALLTSVTIAREKETGTIEQILVSPIYAVEIIVGKIIPYVVLAFVDGVVVLLFAKFWFRLPIEGNILLLLLLSVVYLYAALNIGVFISTLVKTQQVAMMAAVITTVLPSILLSGFIFPIRSMPKLLQWVTAIVPAKYFLIIIRGIVLKGIGLRYFWNQIFFLLGLGTFLLILSILRFRPRVE